MEKKRRKIGGCQKNCFRSSRIGLPQPEGPTTAVNSPGMSVNDRSARAFVSPPGV